MCPSLACTNKVPSIYDDYIDDLGHQKGYQLVLRQCSESVSGRCQKLPRIEVKMYLDLLDCSTLDRPDQKIMSVHCFFLGIFISTNMYVFQDQAFIFGAVVVTPI